MGSVMITTSDDQRTLSERMGVAFATNDFRWLEFSVGTADIPALVRFSAAGLGSAR